MEEKVSVSPTIFLCKEATQLNSGEAYAGALQKGLLRAAVGIVHKHSEGGGTTD